MNRAIEIFWNSGPKTGILSFSGSTTSRTRGCRLKRFHSTPMITRNMTMNRIELFNISDMKTRNLVGAGRIRPVRRTSP